MARRGSFRGSRGISDAQRRKKTWIAAKEATNSLSQDASFTTSIALNTADTGPTPGSFSSAAFILVNDRVVGVGDEVSSLGEEVTILRSRGSLLFPKNTIDVGQSKMSDIYGFGFGITDVRSLVNGAFPGPLTDVDWDGWMFLRTSAVPPVDSVGSVVDVKSMRKIESGDALFFSVQSMSGDSVITPKGNWAFDMRFLILLP